ncbi:MAG: hypothetical protein J6C82_04780 [Clostridia bacterium]|nr:hypothetical protein [Clostridia bacterium]
MKNYLIKLAALSVAALMSVCVLASCGGSSTGADTEKTETTETTETTDNADSADSGDDAEASAEAE